MPHQPHEVDLALPRSVLLALWLPHVGAGSVPLQHAVRAVQEDDEPHEVQVHDPSAGREVRNLPDLLAWWASGSRSVAAVLPAPGDLLGLPAEVSAAGLEAGEALLVETPTGSWAAVPDVVEFGSVYEPGWTVTWHVTQVPSWTTTILGTLGTVEEADRDLRVSLLRATQALMDLDVSRWREDAAEAIARLRGEDDPGWALPPVLDARRVRVLATAVRLREIVALATADDGGAVNLWQADQRSTALREVERAARRATGAATFAEA